MTSPHRPLVVITPVYEDSESASILFRQLRQTCSVAPYVIAMEDGSVRNPLPLSALSDAGLSGEIVYLARNMGHQRAIAMGLAHVAGTMTADAVIVMDCDGEDTCDGIAPLLARLTRDDVDAVVAKRRKRSEPFSFRAFYAVYRKIFWLLTGRRIRFGTFTALNMRAVRRLSVMQEVWVHFAASVMISRLRIDTVGTDRGKRFAGESKMNFIGLALHGMRSIMVFAEDVLVRVGVFCAFLATGATGLLALSVVLKLVGFATPGWFSVAAGLLILILMQAGVLTFVTLMISGLIRSAPPITGAQLNMLIDRIERTDNDPARQARPYLA